MTTTSTLRAVVDETTRLVDGTRDDQLSASTPCTEFDVRALLNHLVGAAKMFALAIEHGRVPDDEAQNLGGDILGDDFRAAWKDAGQRTAAAFERPGVLDGPLTLPFGEFPGEVALGLAVMEIAVHSADLATATGQPIADEAPYAATLEFARASMRPEYRTPGVFGAEQPAPSGAGVVDQLLAFTGRAL